MPHGQKKLKSDNQRELSDGTVKSATLFDHINKIYQDQSPSYFKTLSDGDRKTYSAYMINRFLSMNIHQISVVNAIQQYTQIPAEQHYLFYSSMLPRGRQFNKYIKSKAEDLYEEWLIELLARHFEISQKEAIEYLNIYYEHDKPALLELCKKYGYSDKELKKL